MADCSVSINRTAILDAYNNKMIECGLPVYTGSTDTACGDGAGFLTEIRNAFNVHINSGDLFAGIFPDPGALDTAECLSIDYYDALTDYITYSICESDPSGDICQLEYEDEYFAVPGRDISGQVIKTILWFDEGNSFKQGTYRVEHLDGVLGFFHSVRGAWDNDPPWYNKFWGNNFRYPGDLHNRFQTFGIHVIVTSWDNVNTLHEIHPFPDPTWDNRMLAAEPWTSATSVANRDAAIDYYKGQNVLFSIDKVSKIGLCVVLKYQPSVGQPEVDVWGKRTFGGVIQDLVPASVKEVPVYSIVECENRCEPQPVISPRYDNTGGAFDSRFKWTLPVTPPDSVGCWTFFRVLYQQLPSGDCSTSTWCDTHILDPATGASVLETIRVPNANQALFESALVFPPLASGAYCARVDTILEEIDAGVITETVASTPQWCFDAICSAAASTASIVFPPPPPAAQSFYFDTFEPTVIALRFIGSNTLLYRVYHKNPGNRPNYILVKEIAGGLGPAFETINTTINTGGLNGSRGPNYLYVDAIDLCGNIVSSEVITFFIQEEPTDPPPPPPPPPTGQNECNPPCALDDIYDVRVSALLTYINEGTRPVGWSSGCSWRYNDSLNILALYWSPNGIWTYSGPRWVLRVINTSLIGGNTQFFAGPTDPCSPIGGYVNAGFQFGRSSAQVSFH